MGLCVCTVYTCVRGAARRQRGSVPWHGAQEGARTQHRAREGAEPGAEHGAMLPAQQLPSTQVRREPAGTTRFTGE